MVSSFGPAPLCNLTCPFFYCDALAGGWRASWDPRPAAADAGALCGAIREPGGAAIARAAQGPHQQLGSLVPFTAAVGGTAQCAPEPQGVAWLGPRRCVAALLTRMIGLSTPLPSLPQLVNAKAETVVELLQLGAEARRAITAHVQQKRTSLVLEQPLHLAARCLPERADIFQLLLDAGARCVRRSRPKPCPQAHGPAQPGDGVVFSTPSLTLRPIPPALTTSHPTGGCRSIALQAACQTFSSASGWSSTATCRARWSNSSLCDRCWRG